MEDQATASTVPVAEEVGQLYDRMTGLAVDFLGDDARCGYNAHLGYWDTPESELTYDEATDRLTDITTERLRIGAGSRLLDVGCGVGAPAARIARRTGAHVTGISVSREQIARADVLAREASLGDRLDFRLANAMELPFADASFDAVNHACSCELWLGTRSTTTLRPSSWARAKTRSASASVPNIGCTSRGSATS
ncbi:methyltransferase domain-containing protein [Streptomyces sp. SID3343]|nr:methyltransferase domain-containing protein [Streptomyces sp. SID3343]